MRASRALALAGLGLVLASARAEAQRFDETFKWYIGAQGGVLGYQTQTTERSWIPSGGAHLFVRARRTGLLVSVDQAFTDSAATGYTDVNTTSGVRLVNFKNVRRYSAILTGYPTSGNTKPYFGLGFGLIQVVNPEPQGTFSSSAQAVLAKRLANNKSTDGFISVVAGVETRMNRWVLFGQYQLTSSAAEGNLLRGPAHGLSGGLRVLLGGAKEGIKGGGY